MEKFFDRVSQDGLMGRMEKRVQDKRILGLIRNYLEAGIMRHWLVIERNEGTSQGDPLLADVLLEDVDKELEKHGHKFARYVASERAGARAILRGVYVSVIGRSPNGDIMAHRCKLYGQLKLRVNESKSAVPPQAMNKMKEKARQVTGRNRGRNIQTVVEELGGYPPGWRSCFGLAETPRIFHELDDAIDFDKFT